MSHWTRRARCRSITAQAATLLLLAVEAAFGASDGAWVPGPANEVGRPLGRMWHAAAIDTAHQRLFVVGGFPGSVGDLWQMDLTQPLPRWGLVATPVPGPGHRVASALVYDSNRNRLLLIGGKAASTSQHFSDVWQLKLDMPASWELLAVDGLYPPARAWHSAVFDSLRDRIVIVGGDSASVALDDAWELSLPSLAWSRIAMTGAGSGARSAASVVHDPDHDRLLRFGGRLGGTRFNDVWELSLADGGEWHQLQPSGIVPAPRSQAASTFDRARNAMVVFGGENGSQLGDVLILSLAPSPTWVGASPEIAPGPRIGAAGVYAPSKDQMIVFGGSYNTNQFQDDVWGFNLGSRTWSPVPTSGTPDHPTKRADHLAVYRPIPPQILLVGGYGADGGVGMFDQWRLDLADAPVWSPDVPDSPIHPGSRGNPVAFDEANDRVVVFGNGASNNNEAWASAPGGGSPWQNISPPGVRPLEQEERGAAYDARRGRMLVTGSSATGGWDVWALALDGITPWDRITTVAPSPVRVIWGNSTLYDLQEDRLLLLGGDPLSEVWEFRLSPTLQWRNLFTGAGPTVRGEHAVAFDSRRRRIILSGGHARGVDLPDIWEFVLEGSPGWRQMHPSGMSPLPRGFHTMSYDVASDRMVLFGGHNVNTFLSDTWYLTFDEPTPAQATVARVETGPDFVDVTWQVHVSSEVLVERSELNAGWTTIARRTPDGLGIIHCRDENLRPDTDYSYRISWFESSGLMVGGHAEAHTSSWQVFAARGVRPNPVTTAGSIAFSTPDERPVDLFIVDLQGRRLVSRRLEGLAPGQHNVPLDLAQLTAGLYYVTLEHAGERVSCKIVVMR